MCGSWGRLDKRSDADVHSLILAINQIGLAEGLALGRSLGIDPLLLHNVINTSSGEPPTDGPRVAQRVSDRMPSRHLAKSLTFQVNPGLPASTRP